MHTLFELLAIVLALGFSWYFRRKNFLDSPAGITRQWRAYYFALLIAAMALGAWGFGSLNLVLSEKGSLGKSFIGGLALAILAAEIFKKRIGVKQSTGLYFVPGLCLLIIVGRLGCFFSGLQDYTYGIHTDFVLAYDFGDGLRHPVQLYESAIILMFVVCFYIDFSGRRQWWIGKGFYLFLLVYATQRFVLEFLKPYPDIVAGLNLFQLLALGLILFSIYGLKYEQQKTPL